MGGTLGAWAATTASPAICTGPPEASIVRSLPPAKNPIERLSGDPAGHHRLELGDRIGGIDRTGEGDQGRAIDPAEGRTERW